VGPTDRQFPEFFVGQYGPLRRLGLLLTGDWAQAEELAQEALVRVWWRWPLVRRQQHPEAYARKVLVNRDRSLLRGAWEPGTRAAASPSRWRRRARGRSY
jgi:DNA-directed RNA polymerase specialized sigma24 family protein